MVHVSSMLRNAILTWDQCRRSERPDGYDNIWEEYKRPLPLRHRACQWSVITLILLWILPLLLIPLIPTLGDDGVICILWLLIWNISFIYVSGILSRRQNAFKGRHMGYHDIIAVNIYAAIMVPILRLCEVYQQLKLHHTSLMGQWYIYGSGVLSLYICLHLSLLANVVLPSLQRFSLTSSRLHILPRWIWIIVIGFALSCITIIIYAMVVTGQAIVYSMSYAFIVVALVMITDHLRDQFHVWVHHWAVAALSLPLMSPILSLVFQLDYHFDDDGTTEMISSPSYEYQLVSIVITLCLSSLLVEGAARWSLAPLWHVRGA
jgi:hypothetical protein